MKTAEEFTNNFMQKLKNGAYEKSNLPNNGPEIDDDFVKEQTELFSEMLKSEIGQAAMKL